MDGNFMDHDGELASSCTKSKTIVLVGRTGNGKSATGNSILGRKGFESKRSPGGVTSTCERQRIEMDDGQIIDVIDTPGLFDFSVELDFIGKQIVKCIELAEDGIHAIVVIFSARNRFSKEEEASIQGLQCFFGEKITDYMIILFTGGDEFDEENTFEDYLRQDFPESFQEILRQCRYRVAVFDNKTKDETKQVQQVNQLLSLVDKAIEENGGQPYSNDFFAEVKEGARKFRQKQELVSLKGDTTKEMLELHEQMNKSYDEQIKRITEMVESRLRDTTKRLEQQLAQEHKARLLAEKSAQDVLMRSDAENHELRVHLERTRKETEELRRLADSGRCAIL